MTFVRATLAATVLLFCTTATAGPVEMTADEFQYWHTYKNLQDAPKLVKLSEKAKRAKIAHHLKISPKALDAALAKGEQYGAGIEERTATAMKTALETTILRGRVKEVTINSDADQAVAFVKWEARSPLDFDKEACWTAWAAAEQGHIVKILVVWAVNNSDATVFSAKVGRTAFTKIHKSRINSFASTRYIKMFEDIKRGPQK